MHLAVLTKAESHDDVREVLLSTRNEYIIENSPTDNYWGIGRDRKGKNRLGKILMEIRDLLPKKEARTRYRLGLEGKIARSLKYS